MRNILKVVGLVLVLRQPAAADDRVAQVERLISDYNSEEKEFFGAPVPDDMTTAEQIRRYEAFPAWRYLPKFLELAESRPDDEAAFRCCQWIIDRTRNVGNRDKLIFYADQKAWELLAAHHTRRSELPVLCFRAVEYLGPAQEQFLRGLQIRQDLSRESMGVANLALAELLARKHDAIEFISHRPSARSEFNEFRFRRESPEWGKELIPANAARCKAEATQLFGDVLARFAEVPIPASAPGFRGLTNLGDKARKSLHALQYLTIGSQPPNIVGDDLDGRELDLRDYRGKVVVISFWFTGCGPCMELIPQEQSLITTYKGRPFALLGACTDKTREQAQKTAAEHGIDWPCWFDGENGPIARDWNVLSWPATYVLDRNGHIAAKDLRGEALDAKIDELMAMEQ